MQKKIILAALIAATVAMANPQPCTTSKTTIMKQDKNTFINPVSLFNPMYNGFSHIGQVPAGTELYFLAGQWASDENGKLAATGFEEQVTKTIANLKTALAAARLTTKNIVKQTIYIAGFTPDKKGVLMKVAAKDWGTTIFPASTIVPLPMLATAPGCLMEVEAIATK